ncbi:MAG TPA: M20/M25/M40 family metallo-hydrolase [Pseudobdellovibrionaceae bacterium]|nr:M20/M25/M40 family metallo-hydrolase [Pseudobdellovibrionaceae bacterium]
MSSDKKSTSAISGERIDTRKFLERLVNVPSPVSDQNAVRAAQAVFAMELQKLGFQFSWRRDPAAKTDDLLVAELPGREARWITLVSHVDTVLDVKDTGRFRLDGDFAFGSGVLDNKGGLCVMLKALDYALASSSTRRFGLRVVSSPDEEAGSAAWHQIFAELGRDSVAVLGFEPALDEGHVISSRRGNRWYDIEFKGIEAHAGRCRGEEINAAHEAADVITRLLALRDELRKKFGDGVNLHVGHLAGGRDRHNIVCGQMLMKLDTRFSSFQEREALHSGVEQILKSPRIGNREGRSTEIEFRVVDDCPPFDLSQVKQHQAWVDVLCSRIASIEGHAIEARKAGGAGDVNHMSRESLFVIDGLGPVGQGMHTLGECVRISSLDPRARAVAELLDLIDKQASTNA